MSTKGTIYLIDDDDAVRDALAWMLRTRRMLSEGFDSAERFWTEAQTWTDGPPGPCCALLDLRMPGMSGLALFDRLRVLPWFEALPVIFLSGHADVPTAVDAVLRGAVQFCEKPFSDNQLVAHIERALQLSARALDERQRRRQVQARVASLTERELAVMQLMTEGLPNKLIADRLDISTRTVEVHRARVFEKMSCKSLVELVQVLGQDAERMAPRA